MKYQSASEGETTKIAADMARDAAPGKIYTLSGDLGAGKSVFARAMIRALCDDDALAVPSPTFTLLQTYESEAGPIYHFDLYRVKTPEEIYELGWEDALSEGIIIVEWAERLGSLLPARRMDIEITQTGPESRTITIDDTR